MTSLIGIGHCLGSNTVIGMGQKVGLVRPFKVSDLIRLAPGYILSPWKPVAPLSLQKAPNIWHAGHVNDVLAVPGGVLLAADTGGVWLVSLSPDQVVTNIVPLSDSWERPDMQSLALGAEGFPHVYAAGQVEGNTTRDQLGALYETNMGSANPLFDWTSVGVVDPSGQPLNIGKIYRVIAVTDPALPDLPNRLVLATNKGLYWSQIPPLGDPYAFRPASGFPQDATGAMVPCHGLAAGPAGVVAAAALGGGIYQGGWQQNDNVLRVQSASFVVNPKFPSTSSINLSLWGAAVIASWSRDPHIMYAAAQTTAVPPGVLTDVYAILKSKDGGLSWMPTIPTGPQAILQAFPGNPGSTQGDAYKGPYNQCLGISNSDTVALGWRRGPWISKDSGITWEEHGDDGSGNNRDSNLHGDLHAVYFDQNDPSGNTLYVATDGGVAVTRDLCKTFDSSINRQLLSLQFQSFPSRYGGFPGSSGASSITPDLVAGALQDNGVVYAGAGPNSNSWQRISREEDGIIALVLPNNTLLWDTDTLPTSNLQASQWNGNDFGVNSSTVVVKVPNPYQLSSMPLPFAEPVFHPKFQHPILNQKMFAIAAYTPAGSPTRDLWGYFSDPNGNNGSFIYLTKVIFDPNDVGDGISAVGCDDGLTAFVGTNSGRIYVVDIPSAVSAPPGTQTKMGIGPAGWPSGPVYQFSSFPNGSVFARFGNSILRLGTFLNWEQLGIDSGLPTDEGGFYFMAVDTTSTDTLFVATDYGVHASCDFGDHWLPVSQGLPKRAHPSTLRSIAQATAGAHYLYLTTFGRSAWSAHLNH